LPEAAWPLQAALSSRRSGDARKGSAVVAPSVRYFWQKPVQCNARWTLYSAHASLERGDTIAAGCKLREAMRSYLHSECEYFACLPKCRRSANTSQLAPRTLAIALKKAGHLQSSGYGWIIDMIDIGNRSAHLAFVRPTEIESAITLLHSFLDSATHLIHSRKGGR
jgi:hypothetical protein